MHFEAINFEKKLFMGFSLAFSFSLFVFDVTFDGVIEKCVFTLHILYAYDS